MILVDAQRIEILHTHIDIDISLHMTGKSLQINIAIDAYNRLTSAVKSKGYLTRDKRKVVILY